MNPGFPRDLSPRCIMDYAICAEDRKIQNPYLLELLEIIGILKSQHPGDASAALREYRAGLVMKYAFAIPTWDIITPLLRHSPILEIGAGSGYWALVLASAGADVMALDSRPVSESDPWTPGSGNAWFEEDWFAVEEGDASEAGGWPERSLFLCWPPLENPMAETALENYLASGGKTVMYIGNPASSGTERFHRRLAGLPLVERLALWSWPAVEEVLLIHRVR